MGNFGKWLWGIIILSIISILVGLFAPAPFGAMANSKKMGESVQAALVENGFDTLKTNMSGNVARLIGDVGSEDAKTSAISIAKNAQCQKCAKREAGKRWHVVDGSGINIKKVIPTQSPYTLAGTCTADGGVVLNGYLRSDEEVANYLKQAEGLFSGTVANSALSVARGAPNADWYGVASANLKGLAKLKDCSFGMKDGNSWIKGFANSAADRDGIIAAIKTAGGTGMATSADINLLIKDKDKCQTLFADIKQGQRIHFSTSRADIRDAESRALLDKLATAVRQCSAFHVNIEGHTDSTGDSVSNQKLSQARANTVVQYLVSKGVNPANVTAVGYGETRPIGSNRTRAGRAANRRIEFNVTQSK